jgi:hypothetical protein
MRGQQELLAFNRGRISRLALARTDITRVGMSAQVMTNWMPRAMGSMMLRPGLQWVDYTEGNGETRLIPFVFSQDETALLVLTQPIPFTAELRFMVNDEYLDANTVSATITNPEFAIDASGWTDADESGATSTGGAGVLVLTGTGTNAAIRRQEVTVTETGVMHTLRVSIARGPVTFKVGQSAGTDEYISERSLERGHHLISFTPTGNFHVEFSSRLARTVWVDAIHVIGSGQFFVLTEWPKESFGDIRYDQSGDVIFVACKDIKQYRIERRGPMEWSLVVYEPEDGPFRIENTTPTTIASSALTGDVTLTASRPIFRAGHNGALFRMTSKGQTVEQALTGANQFGSEIRVTGIGQARRFAITISGTFTATLTLQRSIAEPGDWQDVQTYTAPTTTTFLDNLDNQIIYYRIGIKTGGYTSGTANTTLSISTGGITGVVRITSFPGSATTTATATVLKALGGTSATDVWSEGEWSTLRGFPSAVALHEGRLWWAGKDRVWGSISDNYQSFDDSFEGDAGPLSRSIGQGPIDTISWLLSLARLMIGTDGSVPVARSSSFDEPLTPTNFNIKVPITRGSARVAAAKIDNRGIYVSRNGYRLLSSVFSLEDQDFTNGDLTALEPDMGRPGIIRLAVQREPDTRVHCVRSDGTVAVLIFDATENLNCWVDVETDGFVEDVAVLPGDEEDAVYYVVRRTITVGGVDQDVRGIERWSKESECRGGQLCRLGDAHITYSGAPVSSLNMPWAEGREVVIWADGQDRGTAIVGAGGTLTLGGSYANVMAGLGYTARFKSTKLAYMATPGYSGLTSRKRIHSLGVILADTHAQGLRYGPDFNTMDDLPRVERAEDVDINGIWEEYDADAFSFPGEWHTDARLCLEASAPRPCTALAAIIGMNDNPKG